MDKKHLSAMSFFRRVNPLMRSVIVSVLAIFLNAVIWPSWAVAVESERHETALSEARWQENNQYLHQVLQHLKEKSQERKSKIEQRLAEEGGVFDDMLTFLGLSQLALEDTTEIRRLTDRAASLHAQATGAFAKTDAHLAAKKLPAVVLERNVRAREKFEQHYATMLAKLSALKAAQSLSEQYTAAAELDSLMQGLTQQKPRDPFDPNNLPWGTPDPSQTPEPASSADQLSARTGLPLFEQGVQLASNVITAEMLGNPGGPIQADLDPTLDIQLTDAIRAKAAELNDDPVAIYQWVRNHIEFIPSYGSIQGADYTLQHGKGNAFDTASLLIALLRAAHIPARYAFGTVQIPAGKVMNWVGNVQTPEAAANLLGQGGIPNGTVVAGGQASHFNVEHVWVEAWIDYHPSRGGRHQVGDSWVPLDASFKQYDYSDGMALGEQVSFDAQGLADTIEQNSTVNEAEGWVQGVPQAAIEDALTDYRTQLETYLTEQAPDATVGDVLGTQSIKQVIHEQLAATLPYHLVTRKLVASVLPETLRWKFKYQLFSAEQGTAGASLLTIEHSTPELAGQKLALSFKPATEEDEQTLASYLPEPDPVTGEIDPNDIPDTLPGYLINLTGEFSRGDAVIATANTSMTMGAELFSEMGYWQPGRGWQTSQNAPIAGEYRAIALDLQGVSAQQAQQLQTDLESTQQKLEAADYTNLTKQQLVGDLLYSTILSYFALNGVQDQIAEKQANSVGYRAPSYGLFNTSLTPEYWFGIPRNVSADGLGMDVDRAINQRVDRENNTERWVAFNRAQGARMSAMEHLVPEQMFSTEEAPANGISAVKAIQLAAAEGQRIYTITQENLSVALQQIDLPLEIENEIRDAVGAGMESIMHQKALVFFDAELAGYVLMNPATGSASYRISTGENGSLTKTNSNDKGSDIIDDIGNSSLILDVLEALEQFDSIFKKSLGVFSTALSWVKNIHKLYQTCADKVPAAVLFIWIYIYSVLALMLPIIGALIAAALLTGPILIALGAIVLGFLGALLADMFAEMNIRRCEDF